MREREVKRSASLDTSSPATVRRQSVTSDRSENTRPDIQRLVDPNEVIMSSSAQNRDQVFMELNAHPYTIVTPFSASASVELNESRVDEAIQAVIQPS